MRFRYTFVDLRQHLTLSTLDNFQNGDQQKTSNTDDERASKFHIQRHSHKEKFRYAEKTTSVTLKTISVTLRKYRLVCSGNGQFNMRTRAQFYYGRSRPDPSCTRYKTVYTLRALMVALTALRIFSACWLRPMCASMLDAHNNIAVGLAMFRPALSANACLAPFTHHYRYLHSVFFMPILWRSRQRWTRCIFWPRSWSNVTNHFC